MVFTRSALTPIFRSLANMMSWFTVSKALFRSINNVQAKSSLLLTGVFILDLISSSILKRLGSQPIFGKKPIWLMDNLLLLTKLFHSRFFRTQSAILYKTEALEIGLQESKIYHLLSVLAIKSYSSLLWLNYSLSSH